MADPNRHSSMYGSEAMNLRTQIDDDDEDEDVAGAEESIDNPQERFEGHVIEDRAVVAMNGVQDVHHNHLYVPGSDFAPVAAGGGGGGGSGAGGVDQLTLSFQGEVYVFDAVSPEKVFFPLSPLIVVIDWFCKISSFCMWFLVKYGNYSEVFLSF